MAIYYVRKTGNDTTGDGSTGNPWLTIDKAYRTVSIGGGHTINVGDGTYAENNGSGLWTINRNFAAEVVIQAENGSAGAVTITGSSHATYNVLTAGTCANHTFRYVTFAVRPGSLKAFAPNVSVASLTVSNLTFDACRFTGVDESGGYPIQFATGAAGSTVSITFTDCSIDQPRADSNAAVHYTTGSNNTVTLTFTRCTVTSTTRTIMVQAPGAVVVNITGGTWSGAGAAKVGVLLGVDGNTGNGVSGGTITGATLSTTVSHTLLLGAGASGVTVSGCRIVGGDHAVVLKSASSCTVERNTLVGGTLATVLLKGASNCTVRNNHITAAAAGEAAISNYDGAATYVSSGCTITGNTVVATGTAEALEWDANGDANGASPASGDNVIDANVYAVSGTANFGDVMGTNNIASLAALRAAWASYGDGTNDDNSSIPVPAPSPFFSGFNYGYNF
jgi:parallel beta-helix repeat protein